MDLAKKQRTKPADNGTKQLNKTNGYTVHMYAKNNVCFICILLLEIMYSIIQYRKANYTVT